MLTLEPKSTRTGVHAALKRVPRMPIAAPPAPAPVLQRRASCACGGSCPRCQGESALRIGEPDDHFEREADAVADRVMRTADAEPMLQRKADPVAASPAAQRTTGHTSVDQALNSPGQPLPAETRAFFEPRFGVNLSGVRVHTTGAAHASASALDAIAYTVGNHIVFADGQYAPDTPAGRRLLAHELTHTMQQEQGAGGRIQRTCAGKSRNGCYGKCTHPTSGNPGHCSWSGSIAIGCVCYENPRLSPAMEILYNLIMAALIAAGIVVAVAAIAAIIACLMGPCEVAALVAAIGFAGAMIVIGIINGTGVGTSTSGETASAEEGSAEGSAGMNV